jgi:hypothetical protein
MEKYRIDEQRQIRKEFDSGFDRVRALCIAVLGNVDEVF